MNHTTAAQQPKVQWLEISISLYGHSFPRSEDGSPLAFDNYEEALRDHEADKARHLAEIEACERDADDEYEYELHPVIIEDDKVSILSPMNLSDVIETFHH